MNLTLDLATFVVGVLGIFGGGLAAYFGAMTAVRVQIAKMEARLEAFERHAHAIEARIQDAHERLDRAMRLYERVTTIPGGLRR